MKESRRYLLLCNADYLDRRIMENANESAESGATDGQMPAARSGDVLSLKPKGACWYCNAPVDNVRRFCNKICAEDYRSEEAAFSDDSK